MTHLHLRLCSAFSASTPSILVEDPFGVEETVCDSIMSPERNFSETSPLLGPQANGHPRHTTGAINNGPPQPRASECPERDYDAEEAQMLKDDDVAHARNALKYIVPAISIGVRPTCLRLSTDALTLAG